MNIRYRYGVFDPNRCTVSKFSLAAYLFIIGIEMPPCFVSS